MRKRLFGAAARTAKPLVSGSPASSRRPDWDLSTVGISLDQTGRIELVTGGASLGQGYETVMAQICADALGIDYRHITVIHGQTDRIADGVGAHASRATVMTGSAAHDGALKLRALLLEAAAGLLQTSASRSSNISNGRIGRKDDETGPSIFLAELARHTQGITAEGVHRSEHMTYPYGVHLAQVLVDRETGAVAVERYFVAYDIGRAVNPMMIAASPAALRRASVERFWRNFSILRMDNRCRSRFPIILCRPPAKSRMSKCC